MLLGNTEPQPQTVRVTAQAAKLRNPLARPSDAAVLRHGEVLSLPVSALAGEGVTITVPADDLVLVHIWGEAGRAGFEKFPLFAAAFTAPALGVFGSRSKAVILGPRTSTLNAVPYKTFTVWERVTVWPEFTATSVTNSPNWGNPGTSITTPTSLSRITSASGDRGVRLGVRMQW